MLAIAVNNKGPSHRHPAVSRRVARSLSATVFSVQPRNDVLGSLDPAYLAINK